MKDKKFDNKELKNNYPKPGVPADEAWTAMNMMLDAGLQDPPQVHDGSKLAGGKKFPWQYALFVAIVTISILIYYKTYKPAKTVHPHTQANKIKSDAHSTYDSVNVKNYSLPGKAKPGNIVIVNPPVSKNHLQDSASTSPKKNNPATDKATAVNADRPYPGQLRDINNTDVNSNKNAIHNDKTFLKNDKPGIKIRRREREDNKEAASLKYHDKKTKQKDGTGKTKYNNETAKRRIHLQNNQAAGSRQNKYGGVNPNMLPGSSTYQQIDTGNESADLPHASKSYLTQAITKTDIRPVQPDSFYVKNIIDSIDKLALSKKTNTKLKSANNKNNKAIPEFDYGLQWNVPIPVQGTKNYITGTDTHSRPYDLLVPQLWMSKGFKASKLLVGININQQYFTGNKEVRSYTTLRFSPDTTNIVHKISLSKISGLGLNIEYSHKIANWFAGIGINYSINKKALLYEQQIDRGMVSADSLYSINNTAADWQYVYRSKTYASLVLYHTHNKISFGIAVAFPLGSIIAYSNKNIHPVNAHVFIRWSLK